MVAMRRAASKTAGMVAWMRVKPAMMVTTMSETLVRMGVVSRLAVMGSNDWMFKWVRPVLRAVMMATGWTAMRV